MKTFATIAAALLIPAAAEAQSDSGSVSWGAFVDTYYAYHFNMREPGDAPLFTQAVRHNELNVNLAFIEAKLAAQRIRGRLAVQVGTSVSANYAGEPTHGAHSGPLLGRQIQEAVVGYRVSNNLWIDGGIFLSHIGAESWISRDNWTYTRSFIAEFSPYYETGIKATWSPSAKLTGTLALLNGWQNISETNEDKAAGLRLDYTPSSKLALVYSNFLGNEAAEGEPDKVRSFHDFIVKLTPTDRFGLLASFDVGTQGDDLGDSDTNWYGFTAVARVQLSSRVAAAGRFERYSDPDGVFISTDGAGFKANGFSINLDIAPGGNILWRTELRNLLADDKLFEQHDDTLTRSSPFVVSSLALTL